jgi:hypothetical protein
MTLAKGLGFFIWQMTTIKKVVPDPAMLAELLKRAKINWVTIKVGDGQSYYNQIAGENTTGGNDKELLRWIDALKAAGIKVGGWWYLRPYSASAENPGVQPGMIGERIEKLELNHMFYDVEGEWKYTGLNAAIDKALRVDAALTFPGLFCSYRYPKSHAPLNFNRFLHNATITHNAPQVYWMGAHDPEYQLDKSFAEYATYGADRPFVPIGAAYGATVGNAWWEPSLTDLRKFVERCVARGWETYGFWSLDWVLKKGRYDWLSAIAGVDVIPPEPPVTIPNVVRVKIDKANIRLGEMGADVGNLHKGAMLPVMDQTDDWYKVGPFYVAKSVVE